MAYLALVSPEEVIEAMGLDISLMENALPQFESAIVRATLEIQEIVSTSFEHSAGYDMFYVDTAVCGQPQANLFKFRLTNGYVLGPPTVSSAPDLSSPFTPEPNTLHSLSKGLIHVPALSSSGTALDGRYVRVDYTSGFSSHTQAPETIRQAIIALTPGLLLSSSATEEASKIQQGKDAALKSYSATTIVSRLRNFGACLKPLMSEITPI